jgi:hypothetical protein
MFTIYKTIIADCMIFSKLFYLVNKFGFFRYCQIITGKTWQFLWAYIFIHRHLTVYKNCKWC